MPVDNNIMGCQVCDIKFTLITRRHWCRACLKTICSKCSSAFSQNTSLLSKLSRRHENNLCTLCQEATRFAIEERMLADTFKRHTERVPSNSGNGNLRGRQLFKDGGSAIDGPRRVTSATPKQRSTSASLVRPQQRHASVSPMVMDYGFSGDDSTGTPPPSGFNAARRRNPTAASTPKRTSKSAVTPKRRMSVSFADTLSSFVEPESPFQEGRGSPKCETEDPQTAVGIIPLGDENQENYSPIKTACSSGNSLPEDAKPILKARNSTQQNAVTH